MVKLRIADFAIGEKLKFTVRDKDFGTKERTRREVMNSSLEQWKQHWTGPSAIKCEDIMKSSGWGVCDAL